MLYKYSVLNTFVNQIALRSVPTATAASRRHCAVQFEAAITEFCFTTWSFRRANDIQ